MPRSPWTQRIVDVLDDGRWHYYTELVERAGPYVPPGRARRHAETVRARQAARRSGPAATRRIHPTDVLAAGRRGLVVTSIHKLGVSGAIEVDPEHRRARKARA